jgi:hypothetical protein
MSEENEYKIVVVEPEGKRTLVRPRYRWEDSIKIDLRKGDGKVQIGSGQGPLAGSCEHGRPSGRSG